MSIIEKLGKDNFDSWKLQIEAVLIKSESLGYVTGTEIRAEAGSTDKKNWIHKDKVYSDIILALNPSEFYHVKHCTTSLLMYGIN